MAVSKLRFKDENYKTLKLNQLFSKITLKNKGNTITNVLSNSAQYGLVSQREFFYKDIANSDNTEGYFVIEKNDFVYNPRKSNEAPYGPFNQYKFDETGIVSPLYTCLRPKGTADSDYLKHYFSSSAWYKYMYANGNAGIRHDRVSITDDILMKMPISIPSEQEQKKIADFLTTFDKSITAQQNIIADMEEIKKGLLQKIFSQEIRFKDDNGKEYPEWYNLLIGEICTVNNGKGNTQDKINDGSYPFYVRSENVERSNKYIFDCEAIITSGDGVGVGKIYHYINGKFNLHQRCYAMFDFKYVLPKYFYYYFSTHFYKRVRKLSAKNSVDSVRLDFITKMNIKIPCLEEQNKIASFLSTYDKKIEAEKKILADLQEIKKGLLQQMFV